VNAHENAGVGTALKALPRRIRGLDLEIERDRSPALLMRFEWSSSTRMSCLVRAPDDARVVACLEVKGAMQGKVRPSLRVSSYEA
jgi:hypothetical protein